MFQLESLGYFFDKSLNVWRREDYTNIGYNDGDEAEERLAGIIRDADDISVFSSELRNKCVDWQTLYHLTSQRGNVLRPFAHLLQGDVLEIGAGCGAISRFLGENGGNILALEGSQRRASIAASRTRDLDNVQVVAERFDRFNPGRQFDAITLIGVLEYATMFGDGEHPEKDLLTQVRALLKPGGFLFIAIENKLGLKYFAGAPEDHIRQSMYGIEGRYKAGEAKTWGYEELNDLLVSTGYKYTDVLLPYPDYKLPLSIITRRGSDTEGFDAATLAVQNVFNDPQLPSNLTFSLQNCLPEIYNNKLGIPLANSFIFVASIDSEIPLDESILAYHYSTQRKKEYAKETLFLQKENGDINLIYNFFEELPGDSDSLDFTQLRKAGDDYYRGTLLSQKFINTLFDVNWKFDEIKVLMNQWLSALTDFIEHENKTAIPVELNPNYLLPEHFIDAIPQNIIIVDGKPVLFDIEWCSAEKIELGHLLYRGVVLLLNQVRVSPLKGDEMMTRKSFVMKTLASVGFDLTDEDFQRYALKESKYQHQVTGRNFADLTNWNEDHPLSPTGTRSRAAACIYYALDDHEFSEGNMMSSELHTGSNILRWHIESDALSKISKLRFDPVDNRCWFYIRSLVIHDSEGNTVWDFDLQDTSGLCRNILTIKDSQLQNIYYSTSSDPQVAINGIPSASEYYIEAEVEIVADDLLTDIVRTTENTKQLVREDLTEKSNQLQQATQDLEDMTVRLENKAEILEVTLKYLDNTSEQLEDTTKYLELTTNQLENKTEELDSATEELHNTTEELHNTSGKLNKTSKQLENATLQLDSTRTQLGNAKVLLEETKVQLGSTKAQLANTTVQLENTHVQLGEITVQLDETNIELDNKNKQLEIAVAQLDSTNLELNNTKTQLENTVSQLDSTKIQLADAAANIARINAQLAGAMTRIHALETSSSWKLTAPLRAVGSIKRKYKALISVTSLLYRQHGLKKIVSRGMTTLQRDGFRGLLAHLRQQRMLQMMRASAPQAMMMPQGASAMAAPASSQAVVPPAAPANILPVTSVSFSPKDGYSLVHRPAEYCYVTPAQPENLQTVLEGLPVKPHFSIVVPVYNTPLILLHELIESIEAQWYPHWELILANDCSTDQQLYDVLKNINNPQVKVVYLEKNSGISGATNIGIEHAVGDYIVFTDHDDLLTPDCLYEMALCINNDDPDFIYSDEDKVSEDGFYVQPHFKPDWSPDTMMSTMFTCHASCVKKSLLSKTGLLRSEFDGCQDWDFVLRVSEQTSKISHISKVLYHWRIIPQSIASDIAAKDYVLEASKKARSDALTRRGLAGNVEPVSGYPGYFRVNYFPVGNPLVSIIIPTRDNYSVLRRCIDSIKSITRYSNYEIVILDNGSVAEDALDYFVSLEGASNIKVVRHDHPFNFSELNNVGVAQSTGEVLLFLNDDTEVMHADWLERMVGYAQLPHIGIVGAKLLYPGTERIQHAGVLNLEDGPGHAFLNTERYQPGYYMRNILEYNWLAVTGACLMMERSKFDRVGCFDESFPIAYNDIELCFRSVDAGYFNVVCQAVELYHHESVSRGVDHLDEEKARRLQTEKRRLNEKHPRYYQYDPFFNINLHPNGINFEVGC